MMEGRPLHQRRWRRPSANTAKPEIFNTDQGSQFTGEAFTGVLLANGIAISMDGKGSWRDNVFVERLWKSVKYGISIEQPASSMLQDPDCAGTLRLVERACVKLHDAAIGDVDPRVPLLLGRVAGCPRRRYEWWRVRSSSPW